jgi:hypothetical protein
MPPPQQSLLRHRASVVAVVAVQHASSSVVTSSLSCVKSVTAVVAFQNLSPQSSRTARHASIGCHCCGISVHASPLLESSLRHIVAPYRASHRCATSCTSCATALLWHFKDAFSSVVTATSLRHHALLWRFQDGYHRHIAPSLHHIIAPHCLWRFKCTIIGRHCIRCATCCCNISMLHHSVMRHIVGYHVMHHTVVAFQS